MTGFRRLGRAAATAAIVLLAATRGTPQSSTGEVTGRVLDSGGAAVPGATVSARHEHTGLTRSTTTAAGGEYTLTQLPPGPYTVSAELTGFNKALRKGALVNVGSRLTLGFELTVGNLSESVEVTASAPLIETTRSDLAGVVTPREIQNLPMLNRTFAGLSITMPEARPVGNFDPTKTRIGNFAMSGGDGRQLDVNVDGGDNKDNAVGSLLQNFAYESIQEFQVVQHRWTAEAGRSVGGVVNVVSKSGTNDLHGSVFGSYRGDGTRTADFFEQQRQAADPTFEKADFTRNEYGGSIGGPILKDKLFFFGAFEKFRERSNSVLTQGALDQLQAIPDAQPLSEIPTPYDDTLLTAKIDWHPATNHTLFGRFAYQDQSSPNDQIPVPANADLNNGNTNATRNYDFVASHTWALAGTKLNQLTFHVQDFDNQILPNVVGEPALVFPSVVTGPNANTPQQTTVTKYQLRNDFSWQKDAHALKFGANYIHTKLGGYFYFGAKGHTVNFFEDPLTIAARPQGFATPGIVRQIQYADGEASHVQEIDQLAFYAQDDWRLTPKLTLNLGLRWDANIGNLPDQRNNRTIAVLQQIDDPRANAITGQPALLSRTTPSWKEFQPRLGFAYDVSGNGRFVVRGGYGIFYDQLFQNLTLFSLSQSGPEIFSTLLNLTNTAIGQGQLADFRYGVDPLPAPPPADFSVLPTGAFGRINDPNVGEPYVQKWSIGFEKALGARFTLSSDFVHTLGLHEPRFQNINPLIGGVCNPAYPGADPTSPRCVRGASSRYFDRAFVDAGLPANRLEQINMLTTSNRSLYDSLATTLKGRLGRSTVSMSYVLASSRAWGGQPTASYSGNGIAIDPENQFNQEEFGPTRIDERHRVVASAVFDLPLNFQIAPIFQWASSRPYSLNTGLDVDGDGLNLVDRLCEGTDPAAVFAVRGNASAVQALNPRGCTQIGVNSQRTGFVVDPDGSVREVSSRYLNMDVRVTKTFDLGQRAKFRVYADLYNLFDTENLYMSGGNNARLGISQATAAGLFMQAGALYGPGFGPPVGRPFTAVFGARFDF